MELIWALPLWQQWAVALAFGMIGMTLVAAAVCFFRLGLAIRNEKNK